MADRRGKGEDGDKTNLNILAEGIEFEVLLRDISCSRLFKLLFNSLILVRK